MYLVNHLSRDSDQKGAVMGDLLKEIQIMSPEAADVLKQAGLETDSDIQSLTREDLTQLLPRAGDFKLRKNVFEMIHKSRPTNMLQKELGDLKKKLVTSAHIDPGVFMDHNRFIDEQLKTVQLLLNDTKDLLKIINTGQPDSKAEKVMGDLLKEIQIKSPKAADVLKQAGLETDSDIQSLTREDLHEVLPRRNDLRLRKDLFDKIKKSRPPNMPLNEQGELQNNLASSAQIDPGVIMEHIGLIHEQLEYVQRLLNDENRLKNINTRQPYSKADEGYLSTRGGHPQGAQGDSNARTSPHYFQEVTVKYKMVVRGQTFGAHTQLMDQVKRATKGDVRLLENSQDSQIIIVFCPITSRIEWDVKAAMSGVPGDKPVILVKMHHVCESKSSLCSNTSIDDRNIVLQVNVFYHENLRGLLECKLNEKGVSGIKQELLKHSVHRSTDTRASTSRWNFSVPKLPSLKKSGVEDGRGGTTGGARGHEGKM
ncbi:uncharacterized protein LOC128459736 isoform X2 [Pleuronectes platessa]|uniref:uncharacterized protein LOC128459736 isoform X2 n=1 Tax=Pleuronectes platessa TaxID=8262 RepID=UPI00232A3D9C|nr:uncharacterized protein LOC128459736 isoform X2 [Pleuronectes platessa]